MDGIQALASKAKTNPAANAPLVANDDASAASVFAALLDTVGSRFTSTNTTAALDAKLTRNDTSGKARADDARDTVKKARDDKNDDRAAKKTDKTRDEDDDKSTQTDDAKAAGENDDAENNAQHGDAHGDQTAAQVAAQVAVEVPLVTTETIAPVLIAQQVETVVDPAATQQTPVANVVLDAVATTVATDVAVDVKGAVQNAVAVEAPAAARTVAEAAGPTVKQTVAAAVTQTAAVTDETVQAAPTAKVETNTAKTTDAAQTTLTTQRSAAAQAQSQDLSQKVGPETKAQVQVTVTSHAAAQTLNTTSVYDIYAGYNNTQTTTANGQAGTSDTGNALLGTKTPADAAPAQVAPPASPALALAPQPQTQAAQQGPSSSAMRADIAAPAPMQSGGQSSASFGESAFGSSTSSNAQTNATTASAQTTATESPQRTAQQIIDQIKVNITRAAKAGLDKVTIQLKPVELGRIDVQLEMSEDHKVRVTVTADNKDTLALLQNDARTLERSLNDAGLRTDSNNLHFSLRSESDAQTAGDGKNGGKNQAADKAGATDDDNDIAMTYDYAAIAQARGGIDTFA
jgi:flagellar hook-length control protein FliK